MATYDFIFDSLGLRGWCGGGGEAAAGGPMSMADLLGQTTGETAETSIWDLPFPSLNALHDACPAIPQ